MFLQIANKQMQSQIGCITKILHQSEFSEVSSNCQSEQMHSRIGCICMAFHLSEFSNVSSNDLPEQTQSRIGWWVFKCVLKSPDRADA